MAKTKNELLRYRVLDRCLSNPYRKYTYDMLLETGNEKLRD